MHARLLFFPIAFFLAIGMGCVPASDDEAAPSADDDPHCPGSCPDDMVPVERCPTFPTLCKEVPDCDDTLICAHPDDVDPNQANNGAGDVDCDEPVYCPPGTEEVSSCPEGELCSHINLCDEQLICREDPTLCAEVPKCPDGERAVDDCEHDDCYTQYHCSGPVDCLPCSDELPSGCPEGKIEIYAGYCDEVELYDGETSQVFGDDDSDEDDDKSDNSEEGESDKSEEPEDQEEFSNEEDGEESSDEDNDDDERTGSEDSEPGHTEDEPPPSVVCQRVETCEETLFCAPPSACIKDASCGEGIDEIDDCEEAERDCYSIPACRGPVACEAEEYESGCDEEPECPQYYDEVDIDECLGVFDKCVINSACGHITGCLPTEE